MVVCAPEQGLQADVVFLIEATAVNGAYITDIKSNYIIPTLEYFSQGSIDENNYISENSNSFYGIVTYQAADCLPHICSDTFGPFSSPTKVLAAIERLELIGGKGESHANIAEGLATALCCFEELQSKRDPNIQVQRHCVLICNSPPYLMPVFECQSYAGKNAEQLATIIQEKNICLSIISPRKIPPLYKLFEKGGGDLNASQTKNYAKDPRHLVLLKGYSLKERPVSPPPGTVTSQPQLSSTTLPLTSMPSPSLAGNDSPIHNSQIGTPQNPNMIGNNSPTVAPGGMGQSPVYRSPNHPQVGRLLPPAQMGPIGMPNMPAPPGYPQHPTTGARPSWQMPPPTQQARPYMQPNQPGNTAPGGSALIAQLNQPPSISTGNVNVNQFGQMNVNANSPINKMNMPQQPNVQTSMAQNPTIQTSMPQVSQPNPVVTSQAQSTQPPPQQMVPRERHTIWQGVLEWIEKPKNPTDQQKVTRHVPCQVSSNSKDGEPEMKADGWPQKLIMQLMPKQLIGNIGGSYLKNSKSVLFHPTPCEALESLTRVMNSGFAGCVHFTSTPNPTPCDIKVLILLYTADKKAYLGFIPNDQAAFVDRLRKVIQQQKSTQMRQGGNGQPMNPQGGGQLLMGNANQQMGGANPVTSQSAAQQGMMISQTNTLSMGGGQITQNLTPQGQPGSALGQPGPGIGQTGQSIGQPGQSLNQPGSGIGQPGSSGNAIGQIGGNIGQQGNSIGQPGGSTIGGMMGQNVGQQGPNQPNMQPGMMGQPVQRAPFENQLQVERQQNLEKINKLKQTLEAAQQQEQQYKSQLERISHMKTSHLQEALQAAQHAEMQYKIMEQRIAAQSNAQVPQPTNPQQQRMIRPGMANNPGLRHLLQQQPQYRQQILNMQQMGGNGRGQMGQQQMPNAQGGQPNQFDDVSNFDFNI